MIPFASVRCPLLVARSMLALPAMAAIVVYLPALPGGFLSDDYSLLHFFYGADAREVAARVGKTFVSGVGPPSNQYRPLTMASFAANTLLNGADSAAWRLVNVALHAANAALVALLSWQLAGPATRGARAAALVAGLAFAWFAPSAEAVAWIAARFDGMALLWMLVAACAFMASRAWCDRYGLASLAATVLAFMSKESAAIGPALIAGARVGAAARARTGLVRGIVRALARRLAVDRDRRRVFRVPDVDLRRSVPLLSGDLAGIGAPDGKVARRAAGECRLVAAGDAGNGAAPRLRAGRSLRRHRCRVRGPARRARRPRAGGAGRRVRGRDARCCSRTGAGRTTAKADASCTRWRRSPRWPWRCRCARRPRAARGGAGSSLSCSSAAGSC